MASNYVSVTNPARATPFDNSTNGFVSTDAQSAIEESRSFVSTPTSDQSYYVTKQGSDTTGNGSIGAPYLTIAKALTVMTDALPTKRYVISVGPGDYNENLVLKANVFIKGSGPITTRITGTTLNINDTTWNVNAADNRSGFMDITVNPTCTFDFSAQANNTDGKLYCFNIRTSGAWTVTANSVNSQLVVHDSQIFGAVTLVATNTLFTGCVLSSTITQNSGTTAGQGAGTLTMSGGRINSAITSTWTSNGALTLNIGGIAVGASATLTASGASCTVNANADSLPVPASRTFSSGATLVRVNDGFAKGLLSATTNVDSSAATAPTAGQVLVATSSTAAQWQNFFSITSFYVSATATATTTSGTDALLTTMTTTPAAGTYFVTFNTDLQCNNAGGAISISFYVGGSQQATSLRKEIPLDGGTLSIGTGRGIVSLSDQIVVNGSQAIEVRWSTSGGTATTAARALMGIRVA